MSKRRKFVVQPVRFLSRYSIDAADPREKCHNCGARYFGKPARCKSCRRPLSHRAVLEPR